MSDDAGTGIGDQAWREDWATFVKRHHPMTDEQILWASDAHHAGSAATLARVVARLREKVDQGDAGHGALADMADELEHGALAALAESEG